MEDKSYNDIRQAVIDKGYTWRDGHNALNLVFERTSDEITNLFTDFFHICYTSIDGDNCILTIPATTKAGLVGAILEPVTVEGITGTAIIVPNQYPNVWEWRNTYDGFSHYPYFHQVGRIDYWRDGNKDNHIDHVQEQHGKIFGTHGHRMSQNDTYGSGKVNNWSLGCMGSPEPEWRKILDLVNYSCSVYGNLFTLTLLESKDINKKFV